MKCFSPSPVFPKKPLLSVQEKINQVSPSKKNPCAFSLTVYKQCQWKYFQSYILILQTLKCGHAVSQSVFEHAYTLKCKHAPTFKLPGGLSHWKKTPSSVCVFGSVTSHLTNKVQNATSEDSPPTEGTAAAASHSFTALHTHSFNSGFQKSVVQWTLHFRGTAKTPWL